MVKVENPAIEFKDVFKVYGNVASILRRLSQGEHKSQVLASSGGVVALNNINLSIGRGELSVIMGLSGSGKSTLLRLINALIPVSAGDVLVNGRNVAQMGAKELREFRARNISMVFQHFGLMPHRTVLQNVMYGLNIQGVPKARGEEQAKRWIAQVGLEGFENHFPSNLSGGMRQRVGLARALATDADVLLMDEAFSALDPLIRREMQDLLIDLQKRMHKTVVFITHDIEEALRIGDKITIISDGEIVQHGSPMEIVTKPKDDLVSAFTREVNRQKLLTVGQLATAGVSGVPGRPGSISGSQRRVTANTSLEAAILSFGEGAEPLMVVDDAGVTLGSVQHSDIVAAIRLGNNEDHLSKTIPFPKVFSGSADREKLAEGQ